MLKIQKMKNLFTSSTFCNIQFVAQNTISGKVVDEKNQPIAGANIFIEGTYDGTLTSENGNFEFKTSEKGTKTLIVAFF